MTTRRTTPPPIPQGDSCRNHRFYDQWTWPELCFQFLPSTSPKPCFDLNFNRHFFTFSFSPFVQGRWDKGVRGNQHLDEVSGGILLPHAVSVLDFVLSLVFHKICIYTRSEGRQTGTANEGSWNGQKKKKVQNGNGEEKATGGDFNATHQNELRCLVWTFLDLMMLLFSAVSGRVQSVMPWVWFDEDWGGAGVVGVVPRQFDF